MEEFLIDDGCVSTVQDSADWLELCEHCASLFGSDCEADETGDAHGDDGGDEDGFWDLGEVATAGSASPEDVSRQRDETDAMEAMFPDSFVPQVTANEWFFRSPLSKTIHGEMRVRLPADYPSRSPPTVMLDIPGVQDLKGIVRAMLKEFQPDSEVGWAWGERFEELCRVVRERREKTAAEKAAAQARARGDVSAMQLWWSRHHAWSYSLNCETPRHVACCQYCRWCDRRDHVRPDGTRTCQPPSKWEIQELNRKRKAFIEEKKRDEAKKLGTWKYIGACAPRPLPPHPQTGTGRVR